MLYHFGQRYYDPAIGRWMSPDPIGSVDGPNLYRFCRNNPLTFVDYFGLAAEMNENAFDGYFYGEYEPHCYCERHRECKRGGDIRSSFGGVMDLLNNPRFQGSVQAFGGLVEAGIGGGMTLASGIIAAPLGWPVMAHGLDQLITGMSIAFSGSPRETVTAQLLQETGLSPYAAGLIDSSFSIAGSMGGVAAIHASRFAAFPNFRLPVLPTAITEGRGSTLINSRQKIENVIKAIEDFLGGKAKIITNADGDFILMQGDKKIRFDIRDPHGDKPHFHLEQRVSSGKWIDVSSEHRYYFMGE